MKEQVIKHIKETLEIEGKVLHCDLLRALGPLASDMIMFDEDRSEIITYTETFDVDELILIPLNYRTIEEIPDTDKMWEQLLTILTA